MRERSRAFSNVLKIKQKWLKRLKITVNNFKRIVPKFWNIFRTCVALLCVTYGETVIHLTNTKICMMQLKDTGLSWKYCKTRDIYFSFKIEKSCIIKCQQFYRMWWQVCACSGGFRKIIQMKYFQKNFLSYCQEMNIPGTNSYKFIEIFKNR